MGLGLTLAIGLMVSARSAGGSAEKAARTAGSSAEQAARTVGGSVEKAARTFTVRHRFWRTHEERRAEEQQAARA